MCSQVFCTIIKSICNAIDPTNEQTEHIAIEWSNNIIFSIAVRSPDRQTKLITNRITIRCSKLNSNSIFITFCISVYAANEHTKLISIIKSISCSKPLSFSCTNLLSIYITVNINSTYYFAKHVSFGFADSYS